jgi:hypothetical protein
MIPIQSYDGANFLNDDNEIDLFNQIMDEQFIDSTNNRQRLRRAPADDDATTIDHSTEDMICENISFSNILEIQLFLLSS